MSLLLGLMNRGEYTQAVEDELDQFAAAIQTAFNTPTSAPGSVGSWDVGGDLTVTGDASFGGDVEIDGWVGIGTTPLSPLHIKDATPYITVGSDDTTVVADDIIGLINFYSSDASGVAPGSAAGGCGSIRVCASADFTDLTSPTYMAFYTLTGLNAVGDVLGSATEKMRITSVGGVGIGGTPSATTRLLVQGTGVANAELRLAYDSSNHTRFITESNGEFAIRENGTERLRIASGAVKPGANDGGPLGVSGTAWSDLFLASGGVINWNAGNYTITHSAGLLTTNGALTLVGALLQTANDGGALGASGTAWSDLFLASGGIINWNAGNYTITHSAGLLTASGDVSISGDLGIGIATPNFPLHVHNPAAGTVWSQWTNATVGTASTDGLFIGLSTDGNASFWNAENGSSRFYTNNLERARIDAAGNLLMGTTAGTPSPSTGSAGLVFGDGTALATMGSNTAGLYANDLGGVVTMYAISEDGAVTQLSGATATYTESNVTTDRTYNANATSLDELADVVGTIISDLRTRGIFA